MDDNKVVTQEDLDRFEKDGDVGAEFVSSIVSSDESYADKLRCLNNNGSIAGPSPFKGSQSKLQI